MVNNLLVGKKAPDYSGAFLDALKKWLWLVEAFQVFKEF